MQVFEGGGHDMMGEEDEASHTSEDDDEEGVVDEGSRAGVIPNEYEAYADDRARDQERDGAEGAESGARGFAELGVGDRGPEEGEERGGSCGDDEADKDFLPGGVPSLGVGTRRKGPSDYSANGQEG